MHVLVATPRCWSEEVICKYFVVRLAHATIISCAPPAVASTSLRSPSRLAAPPNAARRSASTTVASAAAVQSSCGRRAVTAPWILVDPSGLRRGCAHERVSAAARQLAVARRRPSYMHAWTPGRRQSCLPHLAVRLEWGQRGEAWRGPRPVCNFTQVACPGWVGEHRVLACERPALVIPRRRERNPRAGASRHLKATQNTAPWRTAHPGRFQVAFAISIHRSAKRVTVLEITCTSGHHQGGSGAAADRSRRLLRSSSSRRSSITSSNAPLRAAARASRKCAAAT